MSSTKRVYSPVNEGFPPLRRSKGSKKRVTIPFSKLRQTWVRNYKNVARESPDHFGKVGSKTWSRNLLQYLQSCQSTIRKEDLSRWMERHPWIKNEEIVGRSTQHIVRTPPAVASAFKPARAAKCLPAQGPLAQGTDALPHSSQTFNLPSGSAEAAGANNQAQEAGGSLSKSEKLKSYDAIRDRILELQDMMEGLPEFRAGIPALTLLTRIVSRNYRYAMAGKGREEALHEDLAREGIPHVKKGFKREGLIEVRGDLFESDSDVELDFVLDDES